MRRIIAICIFLFQASVFFGQGQIDSTPKVLVRNEITAAILINSNGWGGEVSYGKMKNIEHKQFLSFNFATIKDAKEIKLSSENGRFVYGKVNEFVVFRFTYGYLNRLYEKKDIGGVEIRWFYKIGPALGLEKPIYYQINDSVVQKLTKNNRDIIEGKASFFKGLGESSIVPGLHATVGTSFEFGKKDLNISAFEGGVNFDIFPREIIILDNDLNQFYFVSLFLAYRFGRIVNPRIKYPN